MSQVEQQGCLKKNGYIMLVVIVRPCFSPDDRVIERGNVKRLALSPSSFHNNRTGWLRNLQCYSKRAGDVDPGSVVFLSLAARGVGLGGGGVVEWMSQARSTFTLLRWTCKVLANLLRKSWIIQAKMRKNFQNIHYVKSSEIKNRAVPNSERRKFLFPCFSFFFSFF